MRFEHCRLPIAVLPSKVPENDEILIVILNDKYLHDVSTNRQLNVCSYVIGMPEIIELHRSRKSSPKPLRYRYLKKTERAKLCT